MRPTLTILFWNTHQKPLQNQISNLVQLHDVDILIFAEFGMEVNGLLNILNQDHTFYHHPSEDCDRIEIFSKFENGLRILNENSRMVIPIKITLNL